LLKEDEDRKKHLEFIKIKEWEEKFDRDQKIKEQKENLREQRLKQRELDKVKTFQDNEKKSDDNFSSGLKNFDIDKTKEH